MKYAGVIISLLLFIMASGCAFVTKTTTKENIETGLFENNPEKLLAAFNKTEVGQTLEEIISLGFRFDAPNVRHLQGASAVSGILGEAAFQNAISNIINDPEKLQTFFKELTPYDLYVVPYRRLNTVNDRIYINRQDSKTTGQDYSVSFAFVNKKLIYRANNLIEVNRQSSQQALLKGLTDLLKEIIGAKSNVGELGKK